MLISTGGTVIRMPVDEVKRLGRATQGVIVMRLRGDEQVSSIALVAESEEPPELEGEEPVAAEIALDPAAENGKNE
jgi:DNA gyrase subunit A